MPPTKNVSDLPQKVAKKKMVKAKPPKAPVKTPPCITMKIAKVAMSQLIKPLETPSLSSPVAQLTPFARKPVNTPKPKTRPIINRKRKNSKLVSQETDYTQLVNNVTNIKNEDSPSRPKRTRKQTLKTIETPLKTSPKKMSMNTLKTLETPLKTSPKKMSMNALKTQTPLKTSPKKMSVNKTTWEESDPESVSLIKPVSVLRNKKTSEKKEIHHMNGKAVNYKEASKIPVKGAYSLKRMPKKLENTIDTKDIIDKQPMKKKRGRPAKISDQTLQTNRTSAIVTRGNKGKVMNTKEIESAASAIENALRNKPTLVHSRSASVNSCASDLSWTKDISTESSLTSSTTTCLTVTSKDFVRFDRKTPIVHIENIGRLNVKDVKTPVENQSSSSSDSVRSSSSSSSSESDDSVSVRDLNLSTSSLTTLSVRPESPLSAQLMCLELDKLTSSLNQFYTEVSKWEPLERDNEDFNSFSVVSEAASEERNLIISINSILNPTKCVTNRKASLEQSREVIKRREIECRLNNNSPGRSSPETYHKDSDEEFSEPGKPIASIRDDKNLVKRPTNVSPVFAIPTAPQKISPVKKSSISSEETFTSDNYNYVSFEQKVCDDEDALSLFAESISGMESSRLSSVASVQEHYPPKDSFQEAYIPKPMRPLIAERYTYKPTRISDDLQYNAEDVPLKTIQPNMIERQNADSSSIFKETNVIQERMIGAEGQQLEEYNDGSTLAECSDTSMEVTNQPQLVFPQYQPTNAVKSLLYKGYCFFHLAKQCINVNCRFPHTEIAPAALKCRLTALSEDNLIEEYLLTCHHPNLRRKYGLLIMQESKKRQATRILMEMAIELGLGVVEREDHNLMVNALEITLLHLNHINFDACDDLLLFSHNGSTMCDRLLSCMAHSQNFSQFKGAFVKLANFMAHIKRPVDIDTARNILERVCILPCEDSLARGMLCLMKNTNSSIFQDAMTNSFETQLSNIESDIHIAYLMAKKEAIEAQHLKSPRNTDVVKTGPRHPSPDTTNLDNLKKAQMAPPVTFKRTFNTEAVRTIFKSPLNPAPKPRFNKSMHWQRGGYQMRRPHTETPGQRVAMTPIFHRNDSST